jgi:hypothetical protein
MQEKIIKTDRVFALFTYIYTYNPDFIFRNYNLAQAKLRKQQKC